MSASKICPQCGNEYALDQRFCPLDGATLKAQGGAGDLVGSVVADRYYVLRKLGEGGMGQVYLAEHVRMGRKSALKVMHPGMVHDADAISRFNREASNASRISHPNVAAIYDFGETGDGLIYLAMEFVEGEALTQIVERAGALAPLRAADIVRQTGDALASAHDMGIVHRDLKPDNIMITKNRDGSDCVKVVDFGIAKSNEGSQKVTKTGLVVGTPEYMSPEQLAGDKLDGRSDIYSLGLVAFHVLTGHLPFPSESAQESMIMRLTDRPKRLGELRADVAWPDALQAVMDRALERDAKLRYGSAAEFGRDFAAAVAAMPAAESVTAGTLIVEAGGGVPPTRVAAGMGGGATAVIDSGTASAVDRRPSAVHPETRNVATAPIGAKGITGRTPMLAAAAVVAVLGIGAASMKFMGTDATPASADSLAARDTTAAADREGAGSSSSGPTTSPGTAGASTEQLGKRLDDAAPEAGVVRAPGGAVTSLPAGTSGPSGPAATPRDITAELRRLDDLVATPEGAPAALRGLAAVEGDVVRGTENHTWVQFIRAQAYLGTGRVTDACTILAAIGGRSNTPGRNEAIKFLHENSCT